VLATVKDGKVFCGGVGGKDIAEFRDAIWENEFVPSKIRIGSEAQVL
jgi:hypothetical protein